MEQEGLMVAVFFLFFLGAGLGFYLAHLIL
jgi:hypothetical protein